MPHVRPRAALAATALVMTGVLSSCGFNYATDQIYNASVGSNHRTGAIAVLSAVIVSDQADQGTFLATFSNNSVAADGEDAVVGMSAGADSPTVKIVGFSQIDLAPGAFLNLADEQGFAATGTFAAGDYVDLVLDFEHAESVEMSVPVVPATDEYEGLDTSASALASASASASPSASASASASPSDASAPTAEPTPTASGSPVQ